MKKLLFTWLTILSLCLGLKAQITLIDPTTEGGFENGATFAANNWTVAQGALTTRVWYLGTGQTGYSGTQGAFIGDNSTTVGSTTSSRVVHLYKSVTLPTGAENIVLSFKYKQTTVDNTYDFLTVFLNGNTPVSATTQTAGVLALVDPSSGTPYSAFTVVTVTVPNSYAGATNNLIFSFKADGSSPHAYGAIDDVSLTYALPACLAASALNRTMLTTSSANFTWTPNGAATAWDVYFGTQPLTAPTATTAPTFTTAITSYSLTGLTPTTPYSIYVRSNCGVGVYSSWTSVSSFTTLCPAPSYVSLPIVEDFENWLSSCTGSLNIPSSSWVSTPVTGDNSWRRDDQQASASWTNPTNYIYSPVFTMGAHSARFHSGYVLSGVQGMLDAYVDCSVGAGKQLTFDYINTSGSDVLDVLVSTDGGSTFTQVGSSLGVSSSWTNKTFNFSSMSPTTVVRLRATSDYGSTDIGVDNLKLAAPPACVAPTSQPTGLTFGGVTNSAINGTFTAVTSTLTSYLVIRTLGTAPNTPTDGVVYSTGTSTALGGTVVATSTGTAGITFATSTGLTANTNYAYFIYTYNTVSCLGGPLYNIVTPLTATVNTCPAKATSPITSSVTINSFNLNWTASAGGTVVPVTYSVEVSTSSTFTTGAVAGSPFLVPAPTTSLALTGLNQLTTYYYRITADNGCNVGATTTASVQTLPTCPRPTALNTSTVTGSTANFTWTPAGVESAWDVYYGIAPLSAPNLTTVPTATSSATSYSATGLYSANTYSVYVRANCSVSDQSLWSVVKVFTTITTCTVPAGLNATGITGTSANYTWTAGSGTAWDIYYGTSPLTAPNVLTVPSATTAINSYSATGLYSGTAYSVYVRNNCGGGDVSVWSAVKTFSTVTTCTVPTGVTVSGISNVSALYSWISAATAFDVYYGTAPLSAPFATTVPTATTSVTSYTATGLTQSTPYALYVRAQCGGGDMSTWTAVNSFTTLCNPLTTFPYTESFSSTFPTCWNVSEGTIGASYHWESATADGSHGAAGPQSGTNFMRLDVYNASKTYNTYNLISPSFSLPTTPQQISYKYFLGDGGYKGTSASITSTVDPYPLSLQASIDNGVTWTSIYSHSSSNSVFSTSSSTVNWQSNTVILGAYTNQTAMFRFVSNSNYGSGTCNQGLDEIVINDAPACAPPTALTTTNTLGHSTNLSWTAPSTGTPANYIWEVRTSGAAGSGTTGIVATGTVSAPTTSVLVAGLTPTTAYSAYVSTDCGSSIFSAWSPAKTFTTTVSCPAPTSLTISSIMPTSAVATWTAGGVEASWFVKYSAPTTTATVATPSYSLMGLTPSTGYSVQVRGYCGVSDTSAWILKTFMTPCQPADIAGIGNTRCGVGSTTVTATSTSTTAIIKWYSAATGGSVIATGTTYVTPVISANTTYYATSSDGLSIESVGRTAPAATTGYLDTNTGLVFSSTSNFSIQSAVIYPVGTGSVTIALQNSSGTEISSTGSIGVSGNGSTPVTVPINLSVVSGTGYRLVIKSYTGITDLVREAGAYPYNSPSGSMAITSGYFIGTSSNYYYFYNIQITSSCESARVPVTATVTAPPTLALTTGTTVCSNVIAALNVTSTLSNYDNYVWSPVTNLYTDAAATAAYTGGTATTVYYKSAIADAKLYTVNATSSLSGCGNIATTTMMTDVPVIMANISPTAVCSSNTVTLNATTSIISTGTVAIGTATTLTAGNTSEPTAFCNRYTGYRMQAVYTAAELNAAGLTAGNINSIAYNITTLGSAATNAAYTVKCGTTTVSAFTNFEPNTGFVTVFPSATYTHVVGVNTIPFSTPYNWDGISNLIIEVSHDGADASNSSQTYYTTTPGNTIVYSNYNSTTGNPSTMRLNIMFNGQIANQGTGSLTWQWNPGAISGNTVTATPINTGTVATTSVYTVTGTNPATTCSNTSTVSVLVNPVPVALVVHNSTQCGYGIPTASVTGMGGIYKWYNAAVSGTLVQSGATYTSAINNTTTFYVAENNGNCEGPRTAVTVSVTTPDAITASISSVSICPNNMVTLSAVNTGTTNVYTYTWTASPVVGSGIPTSVSGATTVIAPGASGNYVYTVVGSDLSCAAIATINLNVIAPPSIFASATPSAVCSGGLVTLNATTGSVGTGSVTGSVATLTLTSTSTTALLGSPYNYWYGGQKTQYIYTAAELSAMGLYTGNVTALAFDVVAAGTQTLSNFQITVGHTSQSVATNNSITTGLTSVYSNIAQTVPNTGLNTYAFSTPFNWDGVSNVVVSVSWSNVNGGSISSGSSVKAHVAPFASTTYLYADNTSAASFAAATNVSSSGIGSTSQINVTTNRPNIVFTGQTITQSPGSLTWQWNPGAVMSNTTSATLTNTGAAPVTSAYTVTAVDPATTCSNTAVVTVTVNPIPNVTATTANSVVCLGSSATLNAGGATTYTWAPQGGQFATTVVTPTATTIYTVSATSFGCNNTATVQIVSVAIPTVSAMASPTTALCAGSSVVLSVTGTATSYTWLPTGGSATTTTVNPLSNTVYTVTGSNGACSAKTSVTVNVAPIPVVTATSSRTLICTSENVVLTAATAATSYTWSANAASATTMSVTVTPTIATNYTVTVSNGTCTATATVSVNVNPCTGIKEVNASNEISIYPNPTNGIIHIAVTNELLENATIEMYDAIGKLVIKEALSKETTTVNLSKLEDGVYFYKVISNNQNVKIGKLVKQ